MLFQKYHFDTYWQHSMLCANGNQYCMSINIAYCIDNWSTSVASPYTQHPCEQVALLVSWISLTAVPKGKVARAFRDSRFYFVPARKGEEVGMHGDDGSAGEGR